MESDSDSDSGVDLDLDLDLDLDVDLDLDPVLGSGGDTDMDCILQCLIAVMCRRIKFQF